MKYRILFFLAVCCLFVGCQPTVEPNIQHLFNNWSSAIKNLNYTQYKKCEAAPLEKNAFEKAYAEYYMVDISVKEIETENKEKVFQYYTGAEYLKREVYFDGFLIDRKTSKKGIFRGNAEIIKFLDGPDKNKGWVIHNRTIVRL